MSTRRPLPWPSWRALAIALSLAFRAAPRATFVAFLVLVSGKRVRAWNQLCVLAEKHDQHYRLWSRYIAALKKSLFVGDTAPVEGLTTVRLSEAGEERLGQLLDRLEQAGCEWVVFLAPGTDLDDFVPHAIAAAQRRYPTAALFYWDEELVRSNGDVSPWIKPAWSERLHLARNCLTGASAIRVADARAALGQLENAMVNETGIWQLEMALCMQGHEPQHIALLLTTRKVDEEAGRHWQTAVEALRPGWSFARHRWAAGFLCATPSDPLRWPTVSVIIPTRDRADLMRTCLNGLARTVYPGELEILIVDNGSSDPEALALFAEAEAKAKAKASVRILRDDGPFNFSRLNNRAAALAKGEFLCLLNNDVEAIDAAWLCAMVRHAVLPTVGAVGAQLLYPDGAIQHAGVAIGIGNAAGHVQRGIAPDSANHAAWHAVTREVSAVTAACLLVSRANYQAVGGLDEAGFAVAFNDVDFCLKLDACGLTNIYCAEARLLHAESRSRPKDHRPDQIARFESELKLLQARWRTEEVCDPRFSSLFSRASEKCVLTLAS